MGNHLKGNEDYADPPVFEKAVMRHFLEDRRVNRSAGKTVSKTRPRILSEFMPNAHQFFANPTDAIDESNRQAKKRHNDIALDPDTTYMYQCGMFDNCAEDQLFGLAFDSSMVPFLEWLTFQTTTVNLRKRYYLTYIGAVGTAAGTPTSSLVDDCCEPGETIEWGTCYYEQCGFPRLRRTTPVRCLDRSDMRWCNSTHQMFFDGSPMDDEFMDMLAVMEVLYTDLACLVFDAQKDTHYFSGIKELIMMEIPTCPWLQGACIDWNGNDVNTGTDAVNAENEPTPVSFPAHQSKLAAWFGEGQMFLDLLERVIEQIVDCIEKMRETAGRTMDTDMGDIIIVGGRNLLRCLQDMFLCWARCTDRCYITFNVNKGDIRKEKVSNKRESIWNFGYLDLCGYNIHLMPHDYECMYPNGDSSQGLADLFILTGSVGTLPILFGQMYDHSNTRLAGKSWAEVTDGGRVAMWDTNKEACERSTVQIQPRVVSDMPKLLYWIKNIPCGEIPCTSENFYTPKEAVTCTPLNCNVGF